jgi:hypothetical protein
MWVNTIFDVADDDGISAENLPSVLPHLSVSLSLDGCTPTVGRSEVASLLAVSKGTRDVAEWLREMESTPRLRIAQF